MALRHLCHHTHGAHRPLASATCHVMSYPLALPHPLLELSDGLAGIETLGAGLGAVHDSVAPVQLEGVVQLRQSLGGHLVSRVLHPAEGLRNGKAMAECVSRDCLFLTCMSTAGPR